MLKTKFVKHAPDATDPRWNNSPYMFYYDKVCYEYNMINLKGTGKPITQIKARHNCAKCFKRYSSAKNNFKAVLYFSVGADAVLTSNLWTEVVLQNSAKHR